MINDVPFSEGSQTLGIKCSSNSNGINRTYNVLTDDVNLENLVLLDSVQLERTIHAGRSNILGVPTESHTRRQGSVVIEHLQLLPLLAQVDPRIDWSAVNDQILLWDVTKSQLT